MEGISALHGGHQVAQRFTNTFLPFKSARLIILSSLFITLNAGNTGTGATVFVSTTVLFSITAPVVSVVVLEQAVNAVSAKPTNAINVVFIFLF